MKGAICHVKVCDDDDDDSLFISMEPFVQNKSYNRKKKSKTEKSRPLASASFPNSFKTSSQGRCQMLKEEMVRSDVCFWKTVSETYG